MGFPVLKPGEKFPILEKNDHYKKVLFEQGLFILSSEHNYRKNVEIFYMQVPYCIDW